MVARRFLLAHYFEQHLNLFSPSEANLWLSDAAKAYDKERAGTVPAAAPVAVLRQPGARTAGRATSRDRKQVALQT
jgi:hypothetical protein